MSDSLEEKVAKDVKGRKEFDARMADWLKRQTEACGCYDLDNRADCLTCGGSGLVLVNTEWLQIFKAVKPFLQGIDPS